MAHVPQLKRCLETILFRTKAMLAVNHLSSAFRVGSLKTRDLQGQVIPSQQSRDEETEDEQDNDGGADCRFSPPVGGRQLIIATVPPAPSPFSFAGSP